MLTTIRNRAIGGILLLALLPALCACSRTETQRSLANRFSEADHAIATYNMAAGLKASMRLTAEETKKLVQALPKGEKLSANVEATPDMQIEFYRGSNSLGTLRSAGGGKLFGTTHATYTEPTGVLESLFWRLRAQAASATPRPAP